MSLILAFPFFSFPPWSLCDSRLFLTNLHDSPKHGGVVHCAAVPATVSELVLALSDAGLSALADVLHVVLVELAQLLLALGQTHQLAAQGLSADDVGLWDQ